MSITSVGFFFFSFFGRLEMCSVRHRSKRITWNLFYLPVGLYTHCFLEGSFTGCYFFLLLFYQHNSYSALLVQHKKLAKGEKPDPWHQDKEAPYMENFTPIPECSDCTLKATSHSHSVHFAQFLRMEVQYLVIQFSFA